MRVALVYDRVNKWGGADRVLLALRELFPNAPLYTSVHHKKKAQWANEFFVKPTYLQKIPFASSFHEYFAPFMLSGFESFTFDEYDVVISVTSESAKGILTKPNTLHVCYCLTPTRYLWSGYEEYFANSSFRFLTKPAVSFLKHADTVAASRPDAYIAISKEVQSRIKQYYKQDSVVIYPPLGIAKAKHRNNNQMNQEFFLSVSRLVPYKRIDIAIEAFNTLRLPLKIVGTGTMEKKLKRMAGPTIEFLGNLTDDELAWYYYRCAALVFPGLEDFGLAIVEAQSFGKPVIAFKGGGALETVVEGKTGEFFYPQTVDALIRTTQLFFRKKFDPKLSLAQAEKFNKERFKKTFLSYIQTLYRQKKHV